MAKETYLNKSLLPLILWLYVFLAIGYVALSLVAWRQESARASAA